MSTILAWFQASTLMITILRTSSPSYCILPCMLTSRKCDVDRDRCRLSQFEGSLIYQLGWLCNQNRHVPSQILNFEVAQSLRGLRIKPFWTTLCTQVGHKWKQWFSLFTLHSPGANNGKVHNSSDFAKKRHKNGQKGQNFLRGECIHTHPRSQTETLWARLRVKMMRSGSLTQSLTYITNGQPN